MKVALIWQVAQNAANTVLADSLPRTAADSLLVTVKDFTDIVMPYAVALAAVGALAMAVLELLKKVLNLRAAFQARHFSRWFLKLPLVENETRQEGEVRQESEIRQEAYLDLVQLSTGAGGRIPHTAAAYSLPATSINKWNASAWRIWHFIVKGAKMAPEEAMFNLESSQMMATLQDSVDVALADPIHHVALFDIMTSGAAQRDVDRWKTACDPTTVRVANAEETRLEREAFARIRQSVMRRFDGFQTYLDHRWGTVNQMAANVVGAFIMFFALESVGGKLADGWTEAPLCLIGGILSPVAKDLVSALRKVKE